MRTNSAAHQLQAARRSARAGSTSAAAGAAARWRSGTERTALLRERLAQPELLVMPCGYDGLTAGLIEKSGFEAAFLSGFSISASRGFPDCQLVSYAEMLEAARCACAATRQIPVMCDGDTGCECCSD